MTRWLIGFAVSLLFGQAATLLFVWCLRRRLERQHPERTDFPWRNTPADVQPWLTGTVERIFFTLAAAFHVSGAVVAMIAWVGLKMATDWNRPGGAGGQNPAGGAWTALLGGLVSMLFALLGGVICGGLRGTIP